MKNNNSTVKTYTLTQIEGGYDAIGNFSEGLALVSYNDERCGYIDRSGKLTIPLCFRQPKRTVVDDNGNKYYIIDVDSSFRFGLACVADEKGKFGYIDTRGEVIIPFVFDDANLFVDMAKRPLAFVTKDGKEAYINTHGEVVLFVDDIEHDDGREPFFFFDGELIAAISGGKLGYTDIHGNTVIPFEYDDPRDSLGYPSSFSDGLLSIKKNGVWRYVDRDGKTVIGPHSDYDNVGDFANGKAIVSRGKRAAINMSQTKSRAERHRIWSRSYDGIRCGLIDKSGNVILPLEYNRLQRLGARGRYFAVRGEREFIIDSDGKVVRELHGLQILGGDSDGYIRAISDDDHIAILDIDGGVVIPPVYDNVLVNGNVAVVKTGDGKCGVIDMNGNTVVPCEFDRIMWFDDDMYAVTAKDGKDYVIHLI